MRVVIQNNNTQECPYKGMEFCRLFIIANHAITVLALTANQATRESSPKLHQTSTGSFIPSNGRYLKFRGT